jgi:hypothetical protein
VPLGYPLSPEDLIIDGQGRPVRIDKAFSWDAPIAAHGMMHMVIANAWKGDPYKIDTLFMYMANMAWNSAMNTAETMRMLTDRTPRPATTASRGSFIPDACTPRRSLPTSCSRTRHLRRWIVFLHCRPIGGVERSG